MRPLLLIAAALMVGVSTACAQNSQQAVMAPVDRSTGPTVPDSRVQDQNTAVRPSPSTGTASVNGPGYGNWRASSGFNSDPGNPDGLPGPSTTTDSNGMTR